MGQLIKFGKDARAKIYEGIRKVSTAVATTLGPNGRCVVISRLAQPEYNDIKLPLKVSKDGVTVANSIHLKDPMENIGQRIVQEAAQKTVLEAGDGTTTTCILVESFVREGLALIDAGANPQSVKEGIDKGVELLVAALKEKAIPVAGDVEKIRQIATISANNDKFIGDLIAEAFEKIGPDGVIDIDKAQGVDTHIKISDGFKMEAGYMMPQFRTNVGKNVCELENPLILLYEKGISTQAQITPAMEIANKNGRPLLIVCEDCDAQALAIFCYNVFQGSIKGCIVKVPYRGDEKHEFMQDLAMATGATYISQTRNTSIEKVKPEHFGNAKKVVVTKEDTMIVGAIKHADYDGHLDELQMDKADKKTEDEKAPVERRIARLKGGVAVINVGAATQTETSEIMDRVDDAVRATKSAIAEGFVAGGGVALSCPVSGISGVVQDLFVKVQNSVTTQLIANAGLEVPGIVVGWNPGINVGFNAKTGIVEDLLQAGVIDPVKVLRCSLQNAASAAGNLLISEAIICDTPN